MTNQPNPDDEYITPKEAAEIAHLGIRQLSRYADQGKIRTIRPGTHRRYNLADVRELARPTIPTDMRNPNRTGARRGGRVA